MPDDENSLVLRLLREMRVVLDQHSRQVAGIDQRIETLHESTITALGFAAHTNVRHDSAQRQIDELRARGERLERGEAEPAD